MRRNSHFTWVILALSAALGSLAYVYRARGVRNPDIAQSRPSITETRQQQNPSPPSSPKPTNLKPEKKYARVRRDADFWPQTPHPIVMRHRTILPARELSDFELSDTTQRVWLVQFGGPLSDEDTATLRKSHHIEWLYSSAEMCGYVRSTAAALSAAALSFSPAIVGWSRLEASDKIIDAGMEQGHAVAGVRVELYPGGQLALATGRARELGARILKEGANWFEAQRADVRAFALELAALDDVYVVEAGRPPYVLHNEQAAANSHASAMISPPFNLTGSGITVMVRDDDRIFAHPDFGSRLLLGPDVSGDPTSQHATHVAGTIGGNGEEIPGVGARGFAPECQIVSFDLNGDESAEPLSAKQTFGAVLSNHSYGVLTGWENGVFHNNQATFGLYSTFARNWDTLVRNNGLIMVKSVGNDRADNGPGHPHDGTLAADGEYYTTADQTSTGKNQLIVGAVIDAAMAGVPNSGQMVMSFSSSGPSADGRLRPELVADGDTLLSTDNTSGTGNVYVVLSGTSMATAAVTGATALFMERYRSYFGSASFPAPHFVRAVYAQTATDLGRPGPDYLHGFGMLDLQTAVWLLDTDAGSGTRIVSSSIDAFAPERFYLLTSDGVTPIKATVCWTDDAGDALSDKALVNDLDLRLMRADDQTVTFPFTLNPAAPEQPAKPGINSVDTIEQLIFQPPAAGNYLLVVRGTTLISSAPFALASSHALTEIKAPTPLIKPSGTAGKPPFFVTFDGNSSTAAPGSNIVRYEWSFGDGASAEGGIVHHIYSIGSFQAALKVTDDKGASASTSVTIAVANKLPIVVVSASPANGEAPLNVMFTSEGSSDPDGAITSIDWNFGDGTSGSGTALPHTYAAAGLYWATMTATDDAGGVSSKSESVFVGQPFTPTLARFALNFAKVNLDSFSISTRNLSILPNFDTTAITGTVRIGTTGFPFVLDAKGNFKSTGLSVKLNAAHAQLSVALKTTNLQNALASSNVANVTVKDQRVSIPFAVVLDNGLAFGSPGLPFSYSAKQNARGTGKFIKPVVPRATGK
jgi:PKD repeat protein